MNPMHIAFLRELEPFHQIRPGFVPALQELEFRCEVFALGGEDRPEINANEPNADRVLYGNWSHSIRSGRDLYRRCRSWNSVARSSHLVKSAIQNATADNANEPNTDREFVRELEPMRQIRPGFVPALQKLEFRSEVFALGGKVYPEI